MSALEVESLLQKMAALRERAGDWPVGAGFEFHELYTFLEKIHAKVHHAEPLIDSRSSAAYTLFIDHLRRVAITVDEALDKLSSSSSSFSRPSRGLYHMLRRFRASGGSGGQQSRGRTRFRVTTARPVNPSLAGPLVMEVLEGQTMDLVLPPKIAKQFEEAHRDLEMLLRLFSTYVADLLPKQPQTQLMEIDSDTTSEEIFSRREESALIGRKQDMEKLLSIPVAGMTEVVVLVGMAGVGKTALARAVYRTAKYRAARAEGFDYLLWVHVSQDFDPERIFRDTMASLREQLQQGEDPESFWWSMMEGLVNKKYLVVLDNVWNEDPRKWNQLLHLIRGKKTKGSKIIVTTRIPAAVAAMQSVTKHNLLPLSAEDSLKMLKTTTVNRSIIRKVAERCNGLPKLVSLINTFLTEDIYRSRARDAIEEFDRRCMKDKGLLDIAKASYVYLPSHLQRCFLYCSLFPLDHIFDAEEMTGLWIAEGFTQVSSRESHVDGDFRKLLDECFDIVNESGCREKMRYRMQFILHNFARNGGQDLYKAIKALRVLDLHATRIDRLPDTFDMLSNLRYLNLSQTDIAKLPELFDKLQYLIYLNIAQTCIEEVPQSIGKIKSLRYLNLSQTCVRELSETIGDLRSLQTLRLSHCKKLVTLPHKIASLTSLQKLDLEGCHYLADVPLNISTMTNLKELNILECSSLDRMPFGLNKVTKLESLPRYIATGGNNNIILELQGLENLKILGLENIGEISIDDAASIQLKEKQKLEHLTLRCSTSAENSNPRAVEELLDLLEPNGELKTLQIISYAGERFPCWMPKKDPQLKNLTHIRLINLKCTSLPALGQLPQLATLEISGMDAIKHVDKELNGEPNSEELNGAPNGNNSNTFRSLKKLTFSQMLYLESWPADGASCPCLEELSIIQCPIFRKLSIKLPIKKLTLCMSPHELLAEEGLAGVASSLKCLSISLCEELSSSSNIEGLTALSSLEELEVSGCDELESLPPGLENLTSLKSLSFIGCSKLHNLSALLKRNRLTSLRVSGCPMLTSLQIYGCPTVASLQISSLEELTISGCYKLESLERLLLGLENLASLRSLSVIGCYKLKDLSYLLHCSGLRSLCISGCPMLTSVPGGLSKRITIWERNFL
ncbi:hypothetical protein ACP70R_008511 [Stipagrostis hirtigluma subsp. patula]